MMNSQVSASSLLAKPVQKWIWQQGWKSLRDVQEQAIHQLLQSGDAIISAPTAGGKTEAAFLPLITRALGDTDQRGYRLLYVSPLKALINDQFSRLEGLCEICDLALTPWHGDVSSSVKERSFKKPAGILLITPESLEAMLMRRRGMVGDTMINLEAVIIDEWHAFLGTERGAHLLSLLNRLERQIGRRIDRIGLSATLGDIKIAGDQLREGGVPLVRQVIGVEGSKQALIQVRSYFDDKPIKKDEFDDLTEIAPINTAIKKIADHIFSNTRGKDNLIFGGAKQRVELFGALLRDLCETENLPVEYFVHHANVSKADREFLEHRLKRGGLPTSAVCTSTLELGIDIGHVDTVCQIGPSGSVAALRQRIGRSGRRKDAPIVLRSYLSLFEPSTSSSLLDRLYLPLVQAIAEIQLLANGWVEPPQSRKMNLSVLVHQILAYIVERGGVMVPDLFNTLQASEPFSWLDKGLFLKVLNGMGNSDATLIEQSPDGTILLGETGEYLTAHYSFYAVFQTEVEFRIIHNGKELGTLPHQGPAAEKMIIIFSGRRWRIEEVREDEKVMIVQPAKGGNPPVFGGLGLSRHSRLDQEVYKLLSSDLVPEFICSDSKRSLSDARSEFHRTNLSQDNVLQLGDSVLVFPWAGSSVIKALQLAFMIEGFEAADEGYAVSVKEIEPERAHEILESYLSGHYDPLTLASKSEIKSLGKFDHFLSDDLLVMQLAETLI